MELKQQISSLELIPTGGGAFEVSIQDEIVYSKLATGEFPDFDEIVSEIRSRISR